MLQVLVRPMRRRRQHKRGSLIGVEGMGRDPRRPSEKLRSKARRHDGLARAVELEWPVLRLQHEKCDP